MTRILFLMFSFVCLVYYEKTIPILVVLFIETTLSLTEKESNSPAALAIALAIMVFPQPGGPYSRTPTYKQSYYQKLKMIFCTCFFKLFIQTTIIQIT